MPTYTYIPKINGVEYEDGATIEVDGPATFSVVSSRPVSGFAFNNSKWVDAKLVDGAYVAQQPLPLGKYWDLFWKGAGGKGGGFTLFTLVQKPVAPPVTVPVRADTEQAALAAIAAGAKHITTTGLTITGALDANGATIELLPGGPQHTPAVTLNGGTLLRATIKVPVTTYANGKRDYRECLVTRGKSYVADVAFAENCGFCIHNSGDLYILQPKATFWSEYFYFGENDSSVKMFDPNVVGGSAAESLFRVGKARYLIEGGTLDNSGGGKSALRGDSPPWPDGTPGGIVRRCKIVGQIGPNPLTEDDGGQMNGIDRWRVKDGYLRQIDGSKKPEAIAFAQSLRAAGKSKREIVRACADKWFPGKVSDHEIDLTIQLREQDVGRFSYARLEDCEVIGDIRLNARMKLELVNTTINGEQGIAGNSQRQYPFPADRVIKDAEVSGPPEVIMLGTTITHTQPLGINLSQWPTVKMDAESSIEATKPTPVEQ